MLGCFDKEVEVMARIPDTAFVVCCCASSLVALGFFTFAASFQALQITSNDNNKRSEQWNETISTYESQTAQYTIVRTTPRAATACQS